MFSYKLPSSIIRIERLKQYVFSNDPLPKVPDGKKLPISLPSADKTRRPGPFESLVGYERIEYLRELMGVKDRLYEDSKFEITRRGNATNPIYIPSQVDYRIVGCTGIPQDSHDLMWFRVHVGKIDRCPLCGNALKGYNYDLYMEEADFFVNWINKLTKGIKLKGFQEEYDEYTREDVLNLAEEGPQQEWESLQKILKDYYNEIKKKDGVLGEGEEEFVKGAAENRFINVSGNLIIEVELIFPFKTAPLAGEWGGGQQGKRLSRVEMQWQSILKDSLEWQQFCSKFNETKEISVEFREMFESIRMLIKELADQCRSPVKNDSTPVKSPSTPNCQQVKRGRRVTPTTLSPIPIHSDSLIDVKENDDQLMERKLKSPLTAGALIQNNATTVSINTGRYTEEELDLFSSILSFSIRNVFLDEYFEFIKYLGKFLNCTQFETSHKEQKMNVSGFSVNDLQQVSIKTIDLLSELIIWLPQETLGKVFENGGQRNSCKLFSLMNRNNPISTTLIDPFVSSPDKSEFSIPFSITIDTKRNLTTSTQLTSYSNQQKIRDEFFILIRKLLEPSTSTDKTIKDFIEKIHPANITWFCDLFFDQFINFCFLKKNPEKVAIGKIQKLEARFLIPTTNESDKLLMSNFSENEIVFLRIIQSYDNHSFISNLLLLLIDKLIKLSEEIINKKVGLEGNFEIFRGIAKLSGFLSNQQIEIVFWRVKLEEYFKLCTSNYSQCLFFIFAREFLKVSSVAKESDSILNGFDWKFNFTYDEIFSNKTCFYIYLIKLQIEKENKLDIENVFYGKLAGNLSNHPNYKLDLDESLFSDSLLFSIFPELDCLNESVKATSNSSISVQSIKSPTRKIRPLTEPFKQKEVLVNELNSATTTITNEESVKQAQNQIRSWFLWKYFKIKEIIDTISPIIVDILMDSFKLTEQQQQKESDEIINELVEKKSKEIVEPFLNSLFTSTYSDEVIQIGVAFMLENIERLLVPRINRLIQHHLTTTDQSEFR